MLAIDTNVAVRYLVNDDPVQSAAARRVIDKGEVLISETVWLETDWVLPDAYGFARPGLQGSCRPPERRCRAS